MLDDIFVELSYKRNGGRYRIVFIICSSIALLIFLAVLNVIPIIMGYNVIFFTGLISFGLVYLLYRLIRHTDMVYEIELSNDIFDTARIIAGKKREELASFSVKDCEYIGPVTVDRFSKDREDAEFVLNVTDNSKIEISDRNWYALVSQTGVKYMVVFTFKDDMYKSFRRYNPRNTAPYVPAAAEDDDASEE